MVSSPSSPYAMLEPLPFASYAGVLPSIFRALALAFVLPILFLALTDIVGWTVHKLILRPLGFARTVRFKDPEPPSALVFAPDATSSAALPRKPRQQSSSTPSTTQAAATTTAKDDKSSPTSSTTSSPVIQYSRLPRSRSSSPRGSGNSSSSYKYQQQQGGLRRRSSDLSLSSFGHRHRAPSVGVDGPLFAIGDPDAEVLLQSPGRSDDEVLPPLSGGEDTNKSGASGKMGNSDTDESSEGEGLPNAIRRRKQSGRAGMPRGGPAFGFTGMSDGSQES